MPLVLTNLEAAFFCPAQQKAFLEEQDSQICDHNQPDNKEEGWAFTREERTQKQDSCLFLGTVELPHLYDADGGEGGDQAAAFEGVDRGGAEE